MEVWEGGMVFEIDWAGYGWGPCLRCTAWGVPPVLSCTAQRVLKCRCATFPIPPLDTPLCAPLPKAAPRWKPPPFSPKP